ncbi:TPA: hypothetical protein JBC15_02530 [Legionella pneumophila subsp. pneumophila]|uniref:hypothetical protein n=1 Tax=Legionella pneumophila TaxID=446 RepID=UPI00077094D5|nr:hypothetical protein [Legionella pneumophila]HAT9213532.1 hypothetical protein [Legionella pneumophila subsp. pneumophila]CZI35262.1 Uncharacterised protein [Legionella pneumophila]HAT9261392.1 hypothetical protein [Legionella pneumophila subsp. pneumophila]HAT9281489.1 hypothetical protein [Legionella pneumophila subsp. pneumophila]HAT9287410.1 hypothetical protein [Legionella pneumophila subsp. pneumophila]
MESVDSLWNFYEISNVSQQIIMLSVNSGLVISKKLTQSERSSRFIERILVFIMDTLQKWTSTHQKLDDPLQGT